MMLYPQAIDDSVQLPSESDSSSDEEIESTKARKKKKRINSDFSDRFKFTGVDVVKEDHLDGLRKFLEKRTPSSLQDNIEKEKNRVKSALAIDIADKEEDVTTAEFNANDSDSDDSLVQEHVETEDKIREKSVKVPKKKKESGFFDEASNDIVKAAGKQGLLAFQEMNLSRPLLKAITACDYNNPTPIQTACIPVALAGRDICACSATGTGKTAAFMLPILERLLYKPKQKAQTRVLVLVPTRELAIQVFQVTRKLARFTGVEVCLCAGGLDLKAQETALKLGLDIVIATPGRLIDHVNNSSFSLLSIEILVLDEADRMLDDTFADQMKEIIQLCSKSRQTMLFSATMTDEIEELAKLSLEKPVRLFINENTETAANLRQEFIRIRDEDTREAIVCALVTRNFPDHTMVFMKSKKDCARMHVLLGLLGVKCAQLHGSLSQTVRVQSLQKFKTQEIDVLVCTELAARGLDIEGVLTVINMHMPNNVQQYIHRVGRTARAGKAGRAISLLGEDDRKLLKSIVKHNKNSTIKQRNIAPEVIVAYKERIDALETSIEKVQNDAIIDNQLRIAEEKLAKAEKRLKTGVDERAGRVFLKTSRQIQKEAEAKAKKSSLKNRKQKEKEAMTPEEKAAEAEAAYQARQAKRAKKPKRLRAIVEDNDMDENPPKKKKKQSDFAKKLTNVSKPAVKKFRYGPNDQEFREAKRDKALEQRLKNKNKRRK